jgi:hypothetical protein
VAQLALRCCAAFQLLLCTAKVCDHLQTRDMKAAAAAAATSAAAACQM